MFLQMPTKLVLQETKLGSNKMKVVRASPIGRLNSINHNSYLESLVARVVNVFLCT